MGHILKLRRCRYLKQNNVFKLEWLGQVGPQSTLSLCGYLIREGTVPLHPSVRERPGAPGQERTCFVVRLNPSLLYLLTSQLSWFHWGSISKLTITADFLLWILTEGIEVGRISAPLFLWLVRPRVLPWAFRWADAPRAGVATVVSWVWASGSWDSGVCTLADLSWYKEKPQRPTFHEKQN